MKFIVLLGISAICFEATLVRSQEPYPGRIAGSSDPIYRSDSVGGSRPYVDGARRSGGERYMPGDSRRSHRGDGSSGRVASHITGGSGGPYMDRGGRDGGIGSHLDGGNGRTYLDSREGGLYGRRGVGSHDRRYSPEGYISGGGSRASRVSVSGRRGGGDRGFGHDGGGSGGAGERRTWREPRGRRGHGRGDVPPREGYILHRGGENHFPVQGGYCPGTECADGGSSAGVGNGIGTGSLDLMLYRIRTGTNEDIRRYELETSGGMGGGMPGMGGHMGGRMPGMGGHMGGGTPGMGGHMGGGMPSMGGHMGGGMPGMGSPPGMGGPLGIGGGGMLGYGAPMGGHMPGMVGPLMY